MHTRNEHLRKRLDFAEQQRRDMEHVLETIKRPIEETRQNLDAATADGDVVS
jgi:F0F1-type ATP synthase membrane subunit b/b'